jgi:hypothetical protein
MATIYHPHSHECGWSISQAEMHDQQLENTFLKLQGCLPYISFAQSTPRSSPTLDQSY